MAKSPKKTPSTPPANPYGTIRFSYGSALKKKPKNTANTNTIQSVETGVPGIIIHFGKGLIKYAAIFGHLKTTTNSMRRLRI